MDWPVSDLMDKVIQITEANGKLNDWDLFWECYPRKVAKLDAMKAWKHTESVRPEIEQVIAAVERLARKTQDIQFCPYPATWLRRGQFFDEE